MSIVGKCPYCKDGMIKMDKKMVQGKITKVYTCSNASWVSEDGEMYELSKDASCSFRIWGNSLARWGKKSIGYSEIKALLRDQNIAVRLFSFHTKQEYYKYITLDKQYGISVLWDVDIVNDNGNSTI